MFFCAVRLVNLMLVTSRYMNEKIKNRYDKMWFDHLIQQCEIIRTGCFWGGEAASQRHRVHFYFSNCVICSFSFSL